MAPKNQSTKVVIDAAAAAAVSPSNGKGKDNSPGTPDARASVRGNGGVDDAPLVVSSVSSPEVPVPVAAPAPALSSSSSSSASAPSSAASLSPVPAPIVSSSSAATATGTGNRAGTGTGARWMSAPEQARLRYVHMRAAASYIGVLKSPFFPQDGAAYLSHLASAKARELEKMKAKLEAAKKLSKDAASSKAKSKSKLGSGSSSRWALLPVVGVSGGLASLWVPLYHGSDSSELSLSLIELDNDKSMVEGGVMKNDDHEGGGKGKEGKAVSAVAAASSTEESVAAAAAGTEPASSSGSSSSSSSSSASGDDRSGGNGGSPRDNLRSSNRVNNSVDNLPLPPAASSSPSSSEAFTGAFNTTNTPSDIPFDTTSAPAGNRGSTIRGGFTPLPPTPSSPVPPAPRLAPLLKGKTNLTEDFLSVVLAKPNPFNGFWTVKSPDSNDATSHGPEAVPFPTAAEYTHEASRPSISIRNSSQVSPGQPSLSSSARGGAGGSSNVRVVGKRKNKKMKKQKQKQQQQQKQKWKKKGEKSKDVGKLSPDSAVVPSVSGVRGGGPPSRSWPLPRWQGHLNRNGDAGHTQNQHIEYMDEGYVRHLWSEKLEPHQQFARLRKAGLVGVADAHGAGHMMREPMDESGIEGLRNPPTNRTHELELMVGAAEAQFDFSSSSSSRQVASAPDLALTYSGLASSVADEPARTSTTAVVDAITSSSFSAEAKPFVPRSLAPDAPEFVPSSSSGVHSERGLLSATGKRSERDSLSATAEEFVAPSLVAVAPAAAVPQQPQSLLLSSSLDPSLSSVVRQPSNDQNDQPQQQQQLTREELLSSSDPGRVNSWEDYRRDHPRALRHSRPSSHLGHQRNRHQQVSISVPRCYGFPASAPAPASPPPSVSLASPGSPPRCDPKAAAAAASTPEGEKKTSLAPAPSPAPFDPSRPNFEENFTPLGQAPASARALANVKKQQQPKASSSCSAGSPS